MTKLLIAGAVHDGDEPDFAEYALWRLAKVRSAAAARSVSVGSAT